MYEFLFIKPYFNAFVLDSILNDTPKVFNFKKCFIYDSSNVDIEEYETIKDNAIELPSVASDIVSGKVYVNAQHTNSTAVPHNRVYYLNSNNECILACTIKPEVRSEINIDLELIIDSSGKVTQ